MRLPCTLPVVLLLTVAARAGAQRIWLTDDRASLLGVDISKGFLSHSPSVVPYYGDASGIVTFFGRIRVDPKLMVTAEIPLAYVTQYGTALFSPATTAATTDRFGNPWIGVQAEFNPSVALEVGVRPALISQTSYAAPDLATDIEFDHFDAWLDHETVVRGVLRAGRVAPRGVFTTGLIGMTAGVATTGSNAMYVNYGVRAGYAWPNLVATAAGTGWLRIANNGVNSFDNRLFNQIELSVSSTRGKLRPTIAVRGFVDPGIRQSVKAILTVGASYILRPTGATPSP